MALLRFRARVSPYFSKSDTFGLERQAHNPLYPGVVGKTHVLNDEDVVQLIKKN